MNIIHEIHENTMIYFDMQTFQEMPPINCSIIQTVKLENFLGKPNNKDHVFHVFPVLPNGLFRMRFFRAYMEGGELRFFPKSQILYGRGGGGERESLEFFEVP